MLWVPLESPEGTVFRFRKPLDNWNVASPLIQADQSLRCAHVSLCWFCHAEALIIIHTYYVSAIFCGF